MTTAIIFCNRKTTVRELNKSLKQHGFSAGEIHGDMEQSARIAELDRFKKGDINILVASDVAARGLDVKGVSHVVNFDAPWHPDDYVHRIGRTGRAGATGVAYTLMGPEDAENIDNIEKLTGQKIPRYEVATPANDPVGAPANAAETEAPRRTRRRPGKSVVDAAPVAKPVADAAPKPAVEAPVRERPRQAPVRQEPVRQEPVRQEPVYEDRVREAAPVAVRDEPRAPRRDDRAAPARDDRRRGSREDGQHGGQQGGHHADQDDGGWNGPVPAFLNAKFGI